MSLIDKIQQQSLLQNKLLAQIAEMSLQAINNTRQSARNFKEGTLDVGKMHFTTPQDKITKEMIMDYQKTEQEKRTNIIDTTTGKPLLYQPTGLTDIIDTFVPIDYGPLGAPATETDVRQYEADYIQLFNDLDVLKVDAKTKDKEVSDKQAEIFKKGEVVQAKKDKHTEAQKHWVELNTELIEVKKKIVKIEAVLAAEAVAATAGTAPPSPVPGATPENLAKGKIKEKELEDNMVTVDADMSTLQAEILTLETEKLKLQTDLPILEGQYIAILADVKKKETAIPAKELEVAQVKQNIVENKEKLQTLNIKNKDTTKRYTDTFNMANRDRYSVQQDPTETDKDYLIRIKNLEKDVYNPDIFLEKAKNEGNLKLMSNLRESLRDEVKITEIVKTFDAQEVFIINTNWKAIQEQLQIKFGINNPIKKVNDYVSEIRTIIDTLQNKQYGTTLLPPSAAASTTLATATAPSIGTAPVDHTDLTPSDFIWKLEKNSLYIGNKVDSKGIWIKIGFKKSQNFIMFSNTTNAKDQFRAFKYINTGNYSYKRIIEALGLNHDDDVRLQIFGPYGNGFGKDDMFKHLNTVIGLQPENGKKLVEDNQEMYGWGLNKEAITKHAKFGKNIILLDKLCHKNILSIKDKNMHCVEHLPNVKVSDTLADIIINICKNEYPSKQTLDTLSSSEKQLFDILLYVSGLRKNKFINKTESESAKDANIKELKQRFKIVEAEIQAGNNNPVVKTELKEIINKLVLYHVISQNNGKKYLQQF
jgi:hypothetical protein